MEARGRDGWTVMTYCFFRKTIPVQSLARVLVRDWCHLKARSSARGAWRRELWISCVMHQQQCRARVLCVWQTTNTN